MLEKNPFKMLLKSRKFLILVLDVGLSIMMYFVAKYIGGDVLADGKFLIGVLQPVALMLIYAIAKEDAARLGG